MGGASLLSGIDALRSAALVGLCSLAAAGTSGAQLHPVQADSGMVVAAHPLAAAVGVTVLQEGGNAVDATVATAFALAVVEPYSSGLGGGGFALTFDPATGSVHALDFRETASSAARRDMFVRDGKADTSLSRTGPLAIAVPGFVSGLWELHGRGGSLAWSHLLEPAVELARQGFPVDARLQERIARHQGRLSGAALEVFLPDGQVPRIGAILRQCDLARTIETIAQRGACAFYEGPLAQRLSRAVVSDGGLLTVEDLRAYRPCWREPVQGEYRGLTVVSMPPPSSGGVHLIQMLNILSGMDLGGWGYGSAASCHGLIEAMKFAFADRSLWLGDPDQVRVPTSRLIAKSYADSLRSRIRADAALSWRDVKGAPVLPTESDETSHLSVGDRDGRTVVATLTINLTFGSGFMAAGTGVLLNDEMDDFVAAPGVANAFGLIGGDANAVAPGKRPLSSMTPTLVLREGRVWLALGSPGGSRIITSVLQVIVNVVDHGMNLSQAVAAPRIHHQWYPPWVEYESYGLSPDTASLLRLKGHRLLPREAMGNVQALMVDRESGRLLGASDPRGMGAASGY
jgi:gamma-glutamyltranspeptidase/glutathione hydrolase